MKIIDFLRKIGILRYGKFKGKYRNAKEMPTELLTDGTYKAEKDLTTRKDLENMKKAIKEFMKGDGEKYHDPKIFYGIHILIFLNLAIYLLVTGFNLWFIILTLFWLGFYYFFYGYQSKGTYSFKFIIVLSISILIFSLFPMLISTSSDSEDSKTKKSDTITLSECEEKYMQYDGKILQIASKKGTLEGAAVIEVDKENNCQITVEYLFKFVSDLPKLGTPGGAFKNYNAYIGNHIEKGSTKQHEVGIVSPAFCNKSEIPDPAILKDGTALSGYYSDCQKPEDLQDEETNVFYNNYSTNFTARKTFWDEIVKKNRFEVYDGSKFYVVEKGEEENSTTWHIDHEKTVEEGQMVVGFDLVISEK